MHQFKTIPQANIDNRLWTLKLIIKIFLRRRAVSYLQVHCKENEYFMDSTWLMIQYVGLLKVTVINSVGFSYGTVIENAGKFRWRVIGFVVGIWM